MEKDTVLLENTNSKTKHVSKKEQINYLVGLSGQNIIYSFIGGSFLTYFLTDIAFIPAFAVSILLILGKIWDGINDPIIGSLVDKHTFKNGEKLRPYLKYTPLPIGIFTALMFVVLGTSQELVWLRIMYFVFIYLCWDIVYTLQDVAIWGITANVTPNPEERNQFVKWARMVGSIIYGVFSMGIPMGFEILVNVTGITPQLGAALFALVLALIGAGMSIKAHAAQERVVSIDKQDSLKESFKLLKTNKILLLISISSLLGGLAFGGNLVTYFFKYMIPEGFLGTSVIGALGLTTIFFALTNVPTFAAMLLNDQIKKLCKDNYVNVLILIQVFNIVFRIIAYFVGYEGKMLWITMFILAIAAFPGGLSGIAQTSLFNDSIDLVEWKTGKRTEGMTFSMQTFFSKASSGISQGLGMLVLGLIGYKAIEDGNLYMAQNATFNKWIWPIVILTPAIASFLYMIPLFFIKYTKEQKALVEADLEKRRRGEKESGESPYYKEHLAQKFEK